MGKSKAETPSLATLMTTFMQEQQAFNQATAADMRQLRADLASTGKSQAQEPKATGKASKKTRKARKVAKRDLDVASYASQKHAPSSDKAVGKVKAWADAGNIARLREYAGVGPRTSGEGDPRVAVTEGNRILAQNVIAACFSKSGKPNAVNNAATSK